MYWNTPYFSTSSPVESLLEKENFTLEELLDEEEIIQECKSLNTRLINFLRDRAQVEQLVRYIVEDAPADAENQRAFKFPFIACEIFTCEIDVILRTLVEDEELMDMLFSFLEPNRTHNSMLAGYFSKVVVCLMLRKTTSLMKYVQIHERIFCQLVDLIGVTSIMEILVRLVGGDDHVYPNMLDVMQWLSENNFVEIIVDKLSPSSSAEVHANAAEVLGTIIRNAPSPLASKLASPSLVARIFDHALENSHSKSALVHSLSVCIFLLDPKRSAATAPLHAFRSQHMYEPPIHVDPETVSAMLSKLGILLTYLDVSSDGNALPTTYGELRPPLGQHRLKIVEFFSVLLGTGDEAAEKELVDTGSIQRILDLFFEYPFNNSLHHHVENVIMTCLDSKNTTIIDHLFCDCNLIEKLLHADKDPRVSTDSNLLRELTGGRLPPRAGYIGHITQIANKLVQLGNCTDHIQKYLQGNAEWGDWQSNVLQERNILENVYRWACGRPTAFHERSRESDDGEIYDRDYDATALANNLSQAFRYNTYDKDDADEDVYLDEESTEVVISSLGLGKDNGSNLFTNSNWFIFEEGRTSEEPVSTSTLDRTEDISLNGTSSSSKEKASIREDNVVGSSCNSLKFVVKTTTNGCADPPPTNLENGNVVDDTGIFQFETGAGDNKLDNQRLPDWVGGHEPYDIHVDNTAVALESSLPNGLNRDDAKPTPTSTSEPSKAKVEGTMPSLFEEDAELVGVEPGNPNWNATNKPLEVALQVEDESGMVEFKKNHWRVEPTVGVVQE